MTANSRRNRTSRSGVNQNLGAKYRSGKNVRRKKVGRRVIENVEKSSSGLVRRPARPILKRKRSAAVSKKDGVTRQPMR